MNNLAAQTTTSNDANHIAHFLQPMVLDAKVNTEHLTEFKTKPADQAANQNAHNVIELKKPLSEDEKWVAASLKGNTQAFDLLINKYQKKVRNIVARYIPNKYDIDDITQDVFISAFTSLSNYRGEAKFYTWLYRIATNTTLNSIKKQIRNRKYFETPTQEEDNSGDVFDQFTGNEISPEQQMIENELNLKYEDQLAQLPNEVRQTFIYREQFGLSYQEIAETLSVPIGTVRSRISRARELLVSVVTP